MPISRVRVDDVREVAGIHDRGLLHYEVFKEPEELNGAGLQLAVGLGHLGETAREIAEVRADGALE